MKRFTTYLLLTVLSASIAAFSQGTPKAGAKLKVLIVDGQNNHVQWPKITFMMKRDLEASGKFSVNVERSYYTWEGEELEVVLEFLRRKNKGV